MPPNATLWGVLCLCGGSKDKLLQPGSVVRSLNAWFRDPNDPATVALKRRLQTAVPVWNGEQLGCISNATFCT